MQKKFNSEEVPDEKMVPSILAALGVNPKTWGYNVYSQSKPAGEAWLVDNPLPMDTKRDNGGQGSS